MNVYIPFTARLPSEYQEVEYIETTGTQYITTSITPNTNTQVEVKIEVTTTAMDKTIFGTNRGSTYYHLTPYSNAWYYGLNGSESHAGTYSNVVGTQYEVVYNNSNSQLSINGTEVGSTSGTTSTNPLEIAKRASDNTKGVFKYFYFNVYNKSTSEYLLKLVPCYRKSDNVIGLYDLVNNQFYTNSGTGTFTKGNDVNMSEVKNIYIGEYKGWKPGANTLAYYKFDGNLNDSSGNGYNLSMANGSFTYGTASGGGLYVQTNQPSRSTQAKLQNVDLSNLTISFYMQFPSGLTPYSASYGDCNPFEFWTSAATLRPSVKGSSFKMINNSSISFTPSDFNSFYHYCIVEDGSNTTLYINGVQQAQATAWLSGTSNVAFKFNSVENSSYFSNDIYTSVDKLGEFIIENKSRTAEEVSDYYNNTKSNYGL